MKRPNRVETADFKEHVSIIPKVLIDFAYESGRFGQCRSVLVFNQAQPRPEVKKPFLLRRYARGEFFVAVSKMSEGT